MYLNFSIGITDIFSYFSTPLILAIIGLVAAIGTTIYFFYVSYTCDETSPLAFFAPFLLLFVAAFLIGGFLGAKAHIKEVRDDALRQAAAAHNIQIIEPDLRDIITSAQGEFHRISFMHIEDGRPGRTEAAFFTREGRSITIVLNE